MITSITACDPRAFADNMQHIPDMSYVVRSSQPWVPSDVISEGKSVPAMRLAGTRYIDCTWGPLMGLAAALSDFKDVTAIPALVPFSTVRMKGESTSGPHLFADLIPSELGSVHLIAGYLRPAIKEGNSLGFFPHLITPQAGRSHWIDREPLIVSFDYIRGWLISENDALPMAANSEFKEVSVSPAMR